MTSAKRHRPLVLDVVVRTAVLLGGAWLYTKVYEAFVPGPADADIGEGLVLFGLVVLASLAWGLLDARRRTIGRLAATWAAVGVLFAAFAIVKGAIGAPGYDASVLWTDVLVLGPFLFGVVALPAMVAGGLTVLVRDNARPHGV